MWVKVYKTEGYCKLRYNTIVHHKKWNIFFFPKEPKIPKAFEARDRRLLVCGLSSLEAYMGLILMLMFFGLGSQMCRFFHHLRFQRSWYLVSSPVNQCSWMGEQEVYTFQHHPSAFNIERFYHKKEGYYVSHYPIHIDCT